MERDLWIRGAHLVGLGPHTVTITATVAARTVTGASARTSATQASAVPGSRIIAPEYREMVKSGQ